MIRLTGMCRKNEIESVHVLNVNDVILFRVLIQNISESRMPQPYHVKRYKRVQRSPTEMDTGHRI